VRFGNIKLAGMPDFLAFGRLLSAVSKGNVCAQKG